VTLDFPADLNPAVWGTETTMTASAFPFRTAIQQSTEAYRKIYSWSTDNPPLTRRQQRGEVVHGGRVRLAVAQQQQAIDFAKGSFGLLFVEQRVAVWIHATELAA
jgi:hypothetical protein